MTTETLDEAMPVNRPSSQATVVVAVIALVLAVPLLGLAAWLWVYTYQDVQVNPNSFAVLGYLFVGAFGIPVLLAAALAGSAVWLRDRRPATALACGVLSLVAIVLPVLWLAWMGLLS